jgi:hypothetical protein
VTFPSTITNRCIRFILSIQFSIEPKKRKAVAAQSNTCPCPNITHFASMVSPHIRKSAAIPMPINGQPHSSTNIFSQHSHSVINSKQSRGLGQDKGASDRAHTASRQPAPREKVMRPHRLSSNSPRSNNKHTPKRKTVHLTLWVKPIVKSEEALGAHPALCIDGSN